jgi:hypothetical protein
MLTSTLLYLIGSESSCDLGNVTYKLNLKNYIAVLVAITADLILKRRNLEILMYIQHIPWCIRYYAPSLQLEMFEDFYVGRGCGSPELCSTLVSSSDEGLLFVESFDLCPSNQYILVSVIPADLFCLRELDIVYVNWETRSSSHGECDVC